MKIATVLSVATLFVSSVSAFAPSAAFSRVSTQFFSEPADEEEGLDLNLEEMFDIFDAADKGADFDKAMDKVKGDN